jgi:hypothetical protein
LTKDPKDKKTINPEIFLTKVVGQYHDDVRLGCSQGEWSAAHQQ